MHDALNEINSSQFDIVKDLKKLGRINISDIYSYYNFLKNCNEFLDKFEKNLKSFSNPNLETQNNYSEKVAEELSTNNKKLKELYAITET